MIRKEDVYKIGKLGKTHGIKGEISMQVDDDVFDRVEADYLVLELDGIMVPFFMEEYRFKTDETALIKFEGIDTQERARELTGTEVFFPREVGKIEYVDEQTINIMFELTDGTLIPASEELIAGIDTEAQVITMNIPEGLL